MDIHDYNYARKGVAGAGLGLGIGGTALGLLNSGILGGWGNLGGWGRGGNVAGWGNGVGWGTGCGGDALVSRYDLGLVQENSTLKADIALRDANTYNDQKMLELYKYFDGKIEGINAVLGSQAVQNQATKDSFQLLQERLDCCKNEMCAALSREASDRKCADNTIVTYANATFYPKQVADVTVGATTVAQTTYNPLPVSSCGGCCCGGV